MKKCLTTILMVLLVFPIVSAICCERGKECIISETCQDGVCGNCTIETYNRDGTINITRMPMMNITSYSYIYNISDGLGEYGVYPYSINCTLGGNCEGDCYVDVIQECEVQEMEGLAVMLFFSGITIFVFILGFKGKLSKSPVGNMMLKRSCILFGMFLLALDTAMISSIADAAGLGISSEIFRYLWIILWAIFLFSVFLIIKTINDVLNLWKIESTKKRMGEYDE